LIDVCFTLDRASPPSPPCVRAHLRDSLREKWRAVLPKLLGYDAGMLATTVIINAFHGCQPPAHHAILEGLSRSDTSEGLKEAISGREMTLLHAPFCLRFKRGLAAYIGGSPIPDVPAATSTGYPNTWPRVPKPSPGTAPMMYSCSR